MLIVASELDDSSERIVNYLAYSDPLHKLTPGSKVFAYMKGCGYVGFGDVIWEAQMAKDFVPAGQPARLFNLPLTEDGIKHDQDDPELCEWVVGVRWTKTFPRDG